MARTTHRTPRSEQVVEESGQERTTIPKCGMIYDGYVKSFNRDAGMYVVGTDTLGDLGNCTALSSFFSRLLGLQTKYVIPTGTRVKVLYDDTPCILGALPTGDRLPSSQAANLSKVLGGAGDRNQTGARVDNGLTQDLPVDLLEGELDLTNTLGVGIQCLMSLARLTAGDRALVETIALNDMVRIVSETFRHHSCWGDEEIYNDGRLNRVEHGTSFDHESWGALSDDEEEQVKMDLNGVGFVDEGTVQEVGRWRYSKYLGFLGDFIHMIVTDPTQALGSLAQTRAGKARVQVMSDGTLLAQTQAEVCIERVCRVQVPVQLKKWDDPEGQLAEEMERLDNRFRSIWRGYAEGAGRQDLADIAYQLREYGRWLNTFHSFSRFLQQSKDWRLDPETNLPPPSWNNGEESETEETNHGYVDAYDTYACIRIMRDGSIVLWAGDGSSINMSGGNVQVHASRSLELASSGDLRLRAGRDLVLLARRHINQTAAKGGWSARSRTYWDGMCQDGSVLVRSGSPHPLDPKSFANDPGRYNLGPDDPEPEQRDQGVVIDALNSDMTLSSYGNLFQEARGTHWYDDGDGAESENSSIWTISRTGDVRVEAPVGVAGVHGQDLELRAELNLSSAAIQQRHFVRNSWSLWNSQSGTGLVTVSAGGQLRTQSIWAQDLDAYRRLSGPENPNPQTGVPAILSPTVQEDDTEYHEDPEDIDPYLDWASLNQIEFRETLDWPYDADGTGIPLWGDRQNLTPPDRHRESLTDQFLRLERPSDWTDEFGTWGPSDLRLNSTYTRDLNKVLSDEEDTMWAMGGNSLYNLHSPSGLDPKNLKPQLQSGYDQIRTSWHYLKEVDDES